jgi:hypothetical protein
LELKDCNYLQYYHSFILDRKTINSIPNVWYIDNCFAAHAFHCAVNEFVFHVFDLMVFDNRGYYYYRYRGCYAHPAADIVGSGFVVVLVEVVLVHSVSD